jgi:tetratricopeptide (TPR) repeat protein
MRNPSACSGVYPHMLRASLLLVCSFLAPAQQRQQQDPLDKAIQTAWQIQNDNSRAQDSIAVREQARSLLQRVPADSPRYASWVTQVAQLYQNAGLSADSRAILQDGLSHTGLLGEANPDHIEMLAAVANAWWQDGNLLKALPLMERAAAAQAAIAAAPPPPGASLRGTVMIGRLSVSSYRINPASAVNVYARLAELYQKLGRPDAVAATIVKMRALPGTDDAGVARFLEQRGQYDDAAAIYKKLTEQSSNPYTKSSAWESLARLYGRQEQYPDAVTAMQQAIAALPSSPGDVRNPWMNLSLATYMRQAGQIEQGEAVYRQLLQQNRGGAQEPQLMTSYAQFLADTDRAPQGASLLKDYIATRPPQDPQNVNLYYSLAHVARVMKDEKSADAYQQAAQDLQPRPAPSAAGEIRIAEEMKNYQTALNQQHIDEAYNLALDLLERARTAVDGQQVIWNIPQLAYPLIGKGQEAKANIVYERLIALTQDWSAANRQPLISSLMNYANFLASQPQLRSEAPAAIERYRAALIDANGSDSGTLIEPARMKLRLANYGTQWTNADAAARDLLELQEQLSGDTSEAYLMDLQDVVHLYDSAGDPARALALSRRAIVIADLLSTPNNNWRPASTRMETAMLLARTNQFDEAVTLGEAAVSMLRTVRQPMPQFAQQLDQIRRMKQDSLRAGAKLINQ